MYREFREVVVSKDCSEGFLRKIHLCFGNLEGKQ